eukprot:c37098_g1_i1 orf=287-559(+)
MNPLSARSFSPLPLSLYTNHSSIKDNVCPEESLFCDSVHLRQHGKLCRIARDHLQRSLLQDQEGLIDYDPTGDEDLYACRRSPSPAAMEA